MADKKWTADKVMTWLAGALFVGVAVVFLIG